MTAESIFQAESSQPITNSAPFKYNLNSINQLHLFGKPERVTDDSSKQSHLADIKAPETNLNLKLMGLRHGTGSIRSSAIVEGPDKKQNIYYKGDELPSGNAVVEEIFIQHMIISRQGKYETLTLFSVLNTHQPIVEEKIMQTGLPSYH